MTMHDMTLVGPSGKGLVYNGTAIRDKGEMLSLTDMWEAAGRPESKRPADWFALPQSQGFIEAVAASSNAEISGIWKSKRGNNGGTFAHWQIGIAYAKALSHEFHMWCNSVVRAAMEGKPVGAALPAEVLDQIERSFGIVRMLAHKITEMEKSLPMIASEMADRLVTAKLAESALLLRSGKTAKQIWDRAGLPPGIKGSAIWFGNRLKEGGCMMEGKADRGEKAIRLFDPDRGETLLDLGLLHRARVYASERMGQGKLKLAVL